MTKHTDEQNRPTGYGRRRVLALSGATGIGVLAGCLTATTRVLNDDGGTDDYGSNGDPPTGGGESASGSEDGAAGGEDYGSYTTITDDSDTVQLAVPDDWADRYSTDSDGRLGIVCAPDTDEFLTAWTGPGVEVWASSSEGSDLDAILDANAWSDSCTDDGRSDVSYDGFTALQQFYRSCGGTDSEIQQIASTPADESFVAFVYLQLVDARDFAVANRIYQSVGVISTDSL